MQDKITAIILSGGQGRRFDGQDKGLIPWRGKTLVVHVIDRLRGQVDQILISCNRNLDQYATLGYEIFTDQSSEFLGPLAGVQSASPAVATPWCLLCPNDMPQLPDSLAAQLLTTATQANSQIAYPVCDERHHYLPALVQSSLLATITDYLASGERSLKSWYSHFSVVTVDYSATPECFANVNTPQALRDIKKPPIP